jgi:hypothetical protein
VPVGVRRHFVAGPGNVAHQLRETFRDPAEREECGLRIVLGQQVEQTAGVRVHARGITIPGGDRGDRLEGTDLEVVLHVHAEQMLRAGGHQVRRIAAGHGSAASVSMIR